MVSLQFGGIRQLIGIRILSSQMWVVDPSKGLQRMWNQHVKLPKVLKGSFAWLSRVKIVESTSALAIGKQRCLDLQERSATCFIEGSASCPKGLNCKCLRQVRKGATQQYC